MQRKSLALVGIWALGTAGLLTILQPQSLTAGPEETRKAIADPHLTISGCDIRVRSDRPAPDKAPTLYVTAKNPGGEAAHVRLALRLMTSPPANPAARTMPQPKESWQEEEDIELDPYQSNTLQFTPKVAVAKGTRAYFLVGSGKDAVTVVPQPAAGEVVAWAGGSQQ